MYIRMFLFHVSYEVRPRGHYWACNVLTLDIVYFINKKFKIHVYIIIITFRVSIEKTGKLYRAKQAAIKHIYSLCNPTNPAL